MSSSQLELVARVNEVRADHGLHALRPSSSLLRSSDRYARWMLRNDRFTHLDSLPISHAFYRRGEVLARCWSADMGARPVVRAWLRSPSHRRVMLSSRYRWIGVSRANGWYDQRRAAVFVGHFGG